MVLQGHTFNELWNLDYNKIPLQKVHFCQLLLMEMSFLNYHLCFWLCIGLHKCNAWIERMMAMFGARWSQPISRIVLALTSKKLVAWVIYDVYMTTMRTLCALVFAWNLLVQWMHTYSSCGSDALFPSASSFACKFCHFLPLCVVDCPKQIYYVVHRLPSIIRATIHFKVHKHPMANGKCRESVKKIKRLIAHLMRRYLRFC